MFFEGDSEGHNSLEVNSVDSAIPHSGISVRFDQLSDHRQIWSDVLKSGVHIQHLDQCLIHCIQLMNLRLSCEISSSPWSNLATVTSPLIFSIFPEWRICPDESYYYTRWRPNSMDLFPKIFLAKALRNTDWLPSFPSFFYLHLEHVLLASLSSPLIIISSVLVTCPELSIYFLAHSTRSSYRFSSLPVDNLPYSLLSSFQSNLSSKSLFQLNALFLYIWPILIPSLYRPFFSPFLDLPGPLYFGKTFLALVHPVFVHQSCTLCLRSHDLQLAILLAISVSIFREYRYGIYVTLRPQKRR